DRLAAPLRLAHRPPHQVGADRGAARRIYAKHYRLDSFVARRAIDLRGSRDAAGKFAGRRRLTRNHRSGGVHECDPRARAALARKNGVAPVSRQAYEYSALSLGIEFSAEVFDIAFAVDQFIFDGKL